ncbi:Uncharacterised protein [uncultured Ruminococcus sp.]|uniref:DHHW protein n=1 Tax=Massiliimalia timonensis TaxID=1987501 RepID=A0A8J6PGZ7_9FIRM|nr:DHHW family protein [Massiliimalia timonensis]MBC8611897.1 hypothetical protein [Massiliimalia timonensis]SCG93307.1 Uncharacterised protein [uncultured Clostridium sp.]SCH88977.1 Uncharacterised protein [uncultured Ruminococcus sp.]
MSEKIKNFTIILLTGSFLVLFPLWGIIQSDQKESISERRPLAQLPEITKESVLSGKFMTDFEKYTLDQFPLRENFRTIKAFATLKLFSQKDNNHLYLENGFISKLDYPINIESIEYATNRFRFIYNNYISGKDINVYLSLIPDKNYFLASEFGYPSINYQQFFDYVTEKMDYSQYIDIVHLLEVHDYYRTDTHWRQERIVDVAKYLAEKMGTKVTGVYQKNKVPLPFYGVYYGHLALPLPADELYYLNNPEIEGGTVYDYETDTHIPIYDFQKVYGKDPYELFLSGSKSLLKINNPNAASEKELIVFRDSFASSLAPLLMEGYSTITLVDIRYISPNILKKFISFEHQDVLFLYSTSVLNNSNTLK